MVLTTVNSLASVFYDLLNRFSGSYTRRILFEALQLLNLLWPYLVSGIVLSTLVKTFISKQRLTDFFRFRNPAGSILLASLIGVISPIGSYVIIPMSAALLGIGVPLPALMALMVSSPLINPNLFVLTAGAMGIEMAILRVLTAFILGSTAGYTTLWLERKKILDPHTALKDHQLFTMEKFTDKGNERTLPGFLTELYKMTRYVSKYFFLAILLAAVIKIAVNPEVIVRLFDSDRIFSVLLSTGAGVPFYVCGGAAIPVVQQLADLGMYKGAVLAFFISGPITKISNLVVLQSVFKKTILIQYLVIGLAGAVFFGLVYNLF